MKYIYPQFSNYELFGIRLGGAGLGNLLFTYTRALKLAKENGCEFVYPSWRSVKVGPYLRHEKDKRFYGNLFKNNSGYVSGIKKSKLLRFANKKVVLNEEDVKNAPDGSLLIYKDFTMNFNGILDFRNDIKEDLIRNLNDKNRKPLTDDFSNVINVHVRLGDFNVANKGQLAGGANNTSLPIEWYVNIIEQINAATDNKLIFNIFSDGTDEQLKPITAIKNTRRVFYGTSIADIVALSMSKVMIASGSSFSLWARYLGTCSSISYKNQIKDRVLDNENGFEIECENEIPRETIEEIKKIYGI